MQNANGVIFLAHNHTPQSVHKMDTRNEKISLVEMEIIDSAGKFGGIKRMRDLIATFKVSFLCTLYVGTICNAHIYN